LFDYSVLREKRSDVEFNLNFLWRSACINDWFGTRLISSRWRAEKYQFDEMMTSIHAFHLIA
jgi:hypothetical protein